MRFELCAATDEISEKPEDAFAAARRRGLSGLLLRTIHGNRFPFYSDDDRTALLELCASGKIPCLAAFAGVYRYGAEQTPLEPLKQVGYGNLLRLLEELSCRMLVLFPGTPELSGAGRKALAEDLRRLAVRAKGRGITLLLGNSPACCCTSAADTVELVEAAGAQGLGICWNPTGSPQETIDAKTLEALQPYLRILRLQDSVREGGMQQFKPLGEGTVDFQSLLRRMIAHQPDENPLYLAIEHGCLDAPEAFAASADAANRLLGRLGSETLTGTNS